MCISPSDAFSLKLEMVADLSRDKELIMSDAAGVLGGNSPAR